VRVPPDGGLGLKEGVQGVAIDRRKLPSASGIGFQPSLCPSSRDAVKATVTCRGLPDKILDNLGSHKGKAVRKAIRDLGAGLLFLPKYSPDLNPIEQVFAKFKTLLRKAEART
jgi:hypothetical protein